MRSGFMPVMPAQLQSTITCPKCGYQATEIMPTDACVAFYDCNGCGETVKPLPGSCCVRHMLRRGKFLVTFDEDFAGVIEACAAPRPGKTPLTWITPQIMCAFWELHVAGYAHSVEVWDDNRHLVAGLYGLAIGGVFFAESRFTRVESASKVAVTVLHHHLAHWGFGIRDAKWMSSQLASLGFRVVSREIFNKMLETLCSKPTRLGRWEIARTLDTPNWQSACAGRPDEEAAHWPAVLKL